MRAFVFLLLSITAYAAPQGGYNYHVQVDSSLRNDFTQEQYQILQQYAHQQLNQQQPQVQLQLLEAPQVSTASQTVTQAGNNEAGGYHFANQLVQQAQLANYEHEQHQQQQQQQAQTTQPQAPQQQPLQAPVETVQPTTQAEVPAAPQPQQFQQPEQTKTEDHHIEAQPQPQQHEARHQSVPQFGRRKSVQYNKEFFYLSAPQEDFEQPKDLEDQLDSLRKNIRVVFIRAPENNNAVNAALQLAKQSMDQQTVVYVLTKQHDSAELANKLHQIRAGSHSKPDVVFIKYRTPEEAEHAQRTIQAQYEALDGPNHFNHEGVAPTHNFVGFPGGHHSSSIHIDPRKKSSKEAEPIEAPSSKYLPATAKL